MKRGLKWEVSLICDWRCGNASILGCEQWKLFSRIDRIRYDCVVRCAKIGQREVGQNSNIAPRILSGSREKLLKFFLSRYEKLE